jgi:hypothetical protein
LAAEPDAVPPEPRPAATIGRGERPFGLVSWATLAALVLHVVEELPSFPAWATEHFGTTTQGWFVVSHVPLLGLATWICHRASRPLPTRSSVWLLLALQSTLFANAVFHGAATIWFHEYSPGVISAMLLYLPVTILLTPRVAAALGPRRSAAAATTGALVCLAAVATLWLP